MNEKRKSQPVVRYDGLEYGMIWTEIEKRTLLSGLKKYGHTDVQSLAEILPNKSLTAVKNMVNNLMTAARRSIKHSRKPPIDMWLEQANIDNTNILIPEALYFISMFERHPDSEDCNGCDLSLAYDYIYRMMRGHPAIELPTKTRKIIYKIISKTVSRMRSKQNENFNQLTNEFYKSLPARDYTRRNTMPEKIGLYKVLRELNTFSVPENQLRISKLDEDS